VSFDANDSKKKNEHKQSSVWRFSDNKNHLAAVSINSFQQIPSVSVPALFFYDSYLIFVSNCRFKISVLTLTYISYVCYHMTRKPIAVVKSVLHRNCSDIPRPPSLDLSKDDDTWCDYAPFDGEDASALLGFLDSSFLFCYAIAMFISGFIAERVSLRYFLSLGMLLSGFFCYTFGYAKVTDIHSMLYFVIIQGLAGIFQTTGWPGVVSFRLIFPAIKKQKS
jgi:Major Facilitator Superfamily